jgi:L-aspartate oxidase
VTRDHSGEDGSARAFTREALQHLMWEHAGLRRDEAGLAHAASVIAAWRAQHREPSSEHDREDENLLLVAEHLVAAARARAESVGAHFRSDAAPVAVGAVREAVAC